MRIAPFAFCLLSLAVASAAPAQNKPDEAQKQLQEVQRDLKQADSRKSALDAKAEALEKELADLRARSIEAAEQQRAQSDELARLEAALADLGQQEQERLAKIEADRAALADLLGALQRLSRLPPEALIARPQPPGDTVKTALLLRSAVPELKARADALANQLTDLSSLRAKLAAQRAKTEKATASLAVRQKDLANLVARREEISRATDAEREQLTGTVTALAGRASDLKDLIEKLEAERKAALARQRAEEAARRQAAEAERERRTKEKVATLKRAPTPPQLGGMVAPVGGTVVVRYGEADEVGAVSRGLTYRGRASGPVVAPADGSVMFAGHFKGYGLLLILEHPNGYHSLLAGMGRIDAKLGQRVLGGEPVGLLSGDGAPTLYFELRRGGQPVNPTRGLSGSDGKGHG
ncbi:MULTISPECIES: murein hydrolase activator EnvC [unclassified Azospirillum]|uniref:murein hydrolase activator EnvC family protein n=1 Tax=unclassified Azospirillum TaxID=2630922 RepID=UPI000B720DF4|nr:MULTISPECIES: peptidoglycan DD-metalloendopeptidase family protein [unclassified Azospirillum]SNS40052.1 Septal ring factor EnvC, activator of murein hydrolases AmiA and AmiB [Azospirillum sp. RU38E]SNS58492.1 Septal ring factor EnvC, activator of murein hydrolases AmiA and AmiB [Azospirillum sp. RU37A]